MSNNLSMDLLRIREEIRESKAFLKMKKSQNTAQPKEEAEKLSRHFRIMLINKRIRNKQFKHKYRGINDAHSNWGYQQGALF